MDSSTTEVRQHRRSEPRGIYLGTWNGSGLSAVTSNAVYGSRDRRDRIKRQISKENNSGEVIRGGRYLTTATACRREDIEYIARFQGMSKAEVDAAIQPFLREMERSASHVLEGAALRLNDYRTERYSAGRLTGHRE